MEKKGVQKKGYVQVKCGPCCPEDKCDTLSSYEIGCQKRATLVDVCSEIILAMSAETSAPSIPSPLDATQFSVYSIRGNGTFVNRHLILVPSTLAIAPPTALSGNGGGGDAVIRYPLISGDNVRAADTMPGEMVKFSKILVGVRNLNGRSKPSQCKYDGHSYTYEASVVMVDGAGGYALLWIDDCKAWNECNPPILEHHPKACFGNSRKLHRGDDVTLLGSFISNLDSRVQGLGVAKGVVSNHRFADPSGWMLAEGVSVDVNAYFPAAGCPIFDKFGRIVAMQVTSTPGIVPFAGLVDPDPNLAATGQQIIGQLPTIGQGGVVGISERFMRMGVKATLDLEHKDYYKCCYNPRNHLETVNDLQDSYYKYRKGYLGVAYALVGPCDYNTFLNNSVGSTNSDLVTYSVTQSGQTFTYETPHTGFRSPVFNTDGNGLYQGPKCKNLLGARIQVLAGSDALRGATDSTGDAVARSGYVYVPGASSTTVPFPAAGLVDSPIDESYTEAFIDTIGKCWIGGESCQVPPAMVTWTCLPEDRINLALRTRDVNIATGLAGENHYKNTTSILATLAAFPSVMDYPWFMIGTFPQVTHVGNDETAGTANGGSVLRPVQLPTATFKPAF